MRVAAGCTRGYRCRARRLLVRVADRGARYPLLIDPLIQQGPKLTATDESGAGQFGYSVAVSGDGARRWSAAPVTTTTSGRRGCSRAQGSTWTQQGPKLTASDAVGQVSSGGSVALSWDGNTALIGAPDDDGFAGRGVCLRALGEHVDPAGAQADRDRHSGQPAASALAWRCRATGPRR